MFEGADRGATFGTLWATDARYLNDSEEVIYGTKIMVEELERQADASGQSPTVRDQLLTLADDVRKNRFDMEWHAKAKRAVPFVACLCQEGDLLSQWRGYGDGGGGYAIGFSPEVLTEFYTVNDSMIQQDDGFGLASTPLLRGPGKVIYGQSKTRRYMAKFAQETSEGMRLVEAGVKGYSWDIYRLQALTTLAGVKHNAFREENEWRFIEHDSGLGKAEFRAGGIGLIPYIKLYFPITNGTHGDPPIREIVVGPGGDRKLRAEALKRLLRQIGIPDTQVRLSKAPFRG
ncbi:DUF2971 domain-containing protein [Rhodococcus opacus]|nr:DUF2971 domain-containing protein [Rhodococcus opacus]